MIRTNLNIRKLVALLCVAAFFSLDAPTLFAQQSQWAVKMFGEMGTERTHNFGSVALHADVEHRFQFKNVYKEDVVIASVSSNCGCTKATAPKTTIRSGEVGEIVARVDTSGREHTKSRKATITVVFSKPFYAEVQLQVKTYIRADVGFEPGSIEFGTTPRGKKLVKKAFLQYEGRPDWALIGIQKSNPGIRAEAREVRRQGGSVVYEILVELKDDAEPGYMRDLLKFKTNDSDAATSSVFLPIRALVTEPLTVKPARLQIGVLRPGEKITKNLVVNGSTPFKILNVETSDPQTTFLKTDLTRAVHVVPVTFRAGSKTGPIRQTVSIETSQSSKEPLVVEAIGYVVDGDANAERKLLGGNAANAPEPTLLEPIVGETPANLGVDALAPAEVETPANPTPPLAEPAETDATLNLAPADEGESNANGDAPAVDPLLPPLPSLEDELDGEDDGNLELLAPLSSDWEEATTDDADSLGAAPKKRLTTDSNVAFASVIVAVDEQDEQSAELENAPRLAPRTSGALLEELAAQRRAPVRSNNVASASVKVAASNGVARKSSGRAVRNVSYEEPVLPLPTTEEPFEEIPVESTDELDKLLASEIPATARTTNAPNYSTALNGALESICAPATLERPTPLPAPAPVEEFESAIYPPAPETQAVVPSTYRPAPVPTQAEPTERSKTVDRERLPATISGSSATTSFKRKY